MADEMPKEESVETPAESPTAEETPEPEVAEKVEKPAPQPEPDEVAWNSLSGPAQNRFREAIVARKEAEEALERERSTRVDQAQKDYQAVTPDVELQEAKRRLASVGMATQEDVRTVVEELRRDSMHANLEQKYSGGEIPNYDRVEVEDHAKRKGFGGNYEAAFKDLYFDEFVDHAKRSRKTQPVSTSAKPSASKKEEPITLDKMRAEFKKDPDGAYDKYVKKDPANFHKLLGELGSDA